MAALDGDEIAASRPSRLVNRERTTDRHHHVLLYAVRKRNVEINFGSTSNTKNVVAIRQLTSADDRQVVQLSG